MNGPSLSRDLVTYLREQRGMSLRAIGELVGLSESFISRVARGERHLTDEHLARFETALGEPLAVLLLDAVDRSQIPEANRAMFEEGLRLVRTVSELSDSLRRPPQTAAKARGKAVRTKLAKRIAPAT